ncbi:N-acetylmuramoyl-L-alanine amidase [Gaiella sp.]|uniref:N-acetylmuramoyl-L-alanine amidase n=1 Tax=Gaiella sp. TaxID=2663207 RepID=UPI0032667D5E
MKLLVATITVLAALAIPAVGNAGTTSISYRSLAVAGSGDRAIAVKPFDLVGVRWRGPGSVRFQARAADGTWGPWLDGIVEGDDQPDFGTGEGTSSTGWRLGNPTWVGPSTAIRTRVTGRVTALRASFVRSPERMVPLRALAVAGAPAIVPRSAWGADETIRGGAPDYAPSVRFAIVHHTAGPNDYSPAQAAAIMRGIQTYHVKSNGWNDIGYNFLVDRYGTVYEGRYGGIDRNVIGAHARGFNTGAVGVAVIGTFGTSAIPPAASRSLEKLLAWRLDLAHVDPQAAVAVVSGGSERYLPGVPVTLRAVSGHRDTGQTSCPGDQLYGQLGSIAARTFALGLPKIFEPTATGSLGGAVRFRARVSATQAWRVVVVDALGTEIGSQIGKGPALDWTWDAALITGTGIRWRIEVGGATPATGSFGKPTTGGPLALTDVAADPATFTPNGDGFADTTTITYTISTAATVSAALLGAAGDVLAEVLPATRQTAGSHTLTFDGLGQPDGAYRIALTATDPRGVVATAELEIVITRTFGSPSLMPAVFSPNGDGKGDQLRVGFVLTAPATVRLRVLRDGKWVATLANTSFAAGKQTVTWDGTKRVGVAPDGQYTAVIDATDGVGTATTALPFLRDANAPKLRLALKPARIWVSEAATLTARVNGSIRRLEAPAPGYLTLGGVKRVSTLVAIARDAAGNRSAALRYP